MGADPHWDARDADRGAGPLRLDGYRRALAEAGVEFAPELVIPTASWDVEIGRMAAAGMIERGLAFDAVFAVTDWLAFGVIRGLADARRSVPGDVAVAGFDNIMESDYWVPSLTTVAPDHDQIAALAVERLVLRMEGHLGEAVDLTSDWRLEVRESSVGRN